jgi:FMN-dependent NADH-azoreductase
MLDVQFIYAEGMGFGPEAVLRAQADAQAQIDAILV